MANFTDLISANHILHYHSVVDAYGHVSVRSPTDPSLFVMSGNRAPALVTSPSDLVTYHVDNASSVDPNAPNGYIERYIHSEMYKRFPDVFCVIHAHAPDVLPYTISGVPLRPVFHMPGFMGTEVPLWDIEEVYNETDVHDLLVRNERQGESLANAFMAPENVSADVSIPDRRVVLMREHGFTTWGESVRHAVYRAVFATTNAQVQTDAMLLRNAFSETIARGSNPEVWGVTEDAPFTSDFVPLTAQQARDTGQSIEATSERPWGLWVAEVEAHPLYKNEGAAGGVPSGAT